MRIPPNCHKGPIKSISTTSTSFPSPRVNHQHHLSQQNLSPTAKENDEKESHENVEKRLEVLADTEQRWAEEDTRRLEEELAREAKYVADRVREREEHWAQLKEDRVQWEQKEDERYEREIKTRDNRFELLLNTFFVTGFPPIEPPPASTPICITDSLIAISPTKTTIRPKTTDTTKTNSITETPILTDTITAANPLIAISPTKTKIQTKTTNATNTNSITKTQQSLLCCHQKDSPIIFHERTLLCLL